MKRKWLLLVLVVGLFVLFWSVSRFRRENTAGTKPWATLNNDVGMTKPEVLTKDQVKVQDVIPASNSEPKQALDPDSVEQLAQVLQEHLKAHPEDANGHYNLGNLYYQGGRNEDALGPLQQAITYNPADVDAHYILGNAFQKLKRYDEAAKEFQQVVKLEPKNHTAYYNLGNAYSAQKKLSEAADAYSKSLQIDEKNSMVHYALAAAYTELNKNQEAIAAARKSVELNASNAEARYLLAILQLGTGDVEGATAQYTQLKTLNPQYAAELAKLMKSSRS